MPDNPYDLLRSALVKDVELTKDQSRDVVRYLIEIGLIDYDTLKEAMYSEYIDVD